MRFAVSRYIDSDIHGVPSPRIAVESLKNAVVGPRAMALTHQRGAACELLHRSRLRRSPMTMVVQNNGPVSRQLQPLALRKLGPWALDRRNSRSADGSAITIHRDHPGLVQESIPFTVVITPPEDQVPGDHCRTSASGLFCIGAKARPDRLNEVTVREVLPNVEIIDDQTAQSFAVDRRLIHTITNTGNVAITRGCNPMTQG